MPTRSQTKSSFRRLGSALTSFEHHHSLLTGGFWSWCSRGKRKASEQGKRGRERRGAFGRLGCLRASLACNCVAPYTLASSAFAWTSTCRLVHAVCLELTNCLCLQRAWGKWQAIRITQHPSVHALSTILAGRKASLSGGRVARRP